MASVDVLDAKGAAVSSMQVGDAIFGVKVRPCVLQEVVQWHQANKRRGTHRALSKSDVNATTRKPFKQKGRGSARQGDWKSPHHRGGAMAFAKRPRDYSYAMPQAKRRLALAGALSARLREGRLKVVETLELPEPKTKLASRLLETLNCPQALLVATASPNLRLGVRNLRGVEQVDPSCLNVYHVLRRPMVVVSQKALQQLQQRLASAEESE